MTKKMRDIRQLLQTLCVALCLSSILPMSAYGQDRVQKGNQTNGRGTTDLLEEFLDANPQAIEVKILSEGTMAYLCANDSNLFIRLSIGNPMLFMRMLMQGLTVYVDPTGAKKKKYSVVFPSARDVQSNMSRISNGQRADSQGRPDVGPLLGQMNKVGATFKINGKVQTMELTRSLIELDTEHEVLNFYALIPKAQMMDEKKLVSDWTLGIYLASPIGVLEGPREGNGMGEPQRPGGMPERRGMSSNSQEMEKLMKKKIVVWEKFSIDEANSVNLK